MYLHHASCMPHAYVWPDHVLTSIWSRVCEFESVELRKDVDYAHCSTPQACSCSSSPSPEAPTRLYPSLWLCKTIVTLQMSTLLTVHVAAQALQALEAPRLSTDLSFKVVNLAPPSSRCKYNSIGRQETCNIPKRYQHSWAWHTYIHVHVHTLVMHRYSLLPIFR